MAAEPVDATVVEEPGMEIVPTAPAAPPATLFGTSDPAEVIERASAVAASLKDVLTRQRMIEIIQRKEYVKVEGWQTLASMLGVVPVVVWTRQIDGGWEARVEARTVDGRVVGAAEAMCIESEGGNWGPRATSNARRSMAQTRAISKSLRGPLGFVVTLAGYQATPAEEMTHLQMTPATPMSPPTAREPQATRPTATVAQRKLIFAKAKEKDMPDDAIRELLRNVAGTPHSDRIAHADVDAVLAAIAEA